MRAVDALINSAGAVRARCRTLGLVGGRGQVAARPVRVGHALLEGRRRLEEHVSELGPRHRSEQHRRGDDVQAEEHVGAGLAPRLQVGPDQAQRDAGEQRDDEQVRAHDAERRIALRGDIDPDEEPEPVSADADHQAANPPKQRQDGGRGSRGRRVAKHHDGGGDGVDHEPVHGQQMGGPAPRVAEFPGCRDVHKAGLDGERHPFAATNLLCPLLLDFRQLSKKYFALPLCTMSNSVPAATRTIMTTT